MSKAAAAGSQSLPSVQTAVRRASRISAPAERKIEGREIQQDHEQYALTYGMMLGIRVTVSLFHSFVLFCFLKCLFWFRLVAEIWILRSYPPLKA